jgi:hypothetical protein
VAFVVAHPFVVSLSSHERPSSFDTPRANGHELPRTVA